MKLDSNIIVIILATLVIAGGAYWYFFTGTGNQPPLTTTTQNEAQLQFKILVSELQPISFNTDIFSDARFMSLADLTTPISPEQSGRLDPFATLSGVQ